MQHDKYLTISSLIKIIKKLFKQFKIITEIHLFSNGAAQHFKQRFLLNAVIQIPQFLGLPYEQINISYNMFPTSNGKGAVNGVGGTIRRMGMAKVTCRKEIIANSKDYKRQGHQKGLHKGQCHPHLQGGGGEGDQAASEVSRTCP